MDGWIVLIVLAGLPILAYYRFQNNAKAIVCIFDALFIIVDKYGDSNDKEAYEALLDRYRNKDGKLTKVNSTVLYQLRRDARFFIAQHFANKESAMKMYEASIRSIIER
ncbi:hypothetical protein [Desulfurispira natronophila]|uniref:Uncharacterized protein n=1 Tax=Desulfurispira natronophila TaxID=682562 RepID=A0A7W7Y6B2_9BACT|nr:hypothetical protein [Desulfurispira natronophila]MBB5022792.1 hypothetical protein [Desulfurispira natronophila]